MDIWPAVSVRPACAANRAFRPVGCRQRDEIRERAGNGAGGAMKFRLDTFCGLYCGACDVLQANVSGTVETLAQAWGTQPEQLRCRGCKSEVNAVYCVDCSIRGCSQRRGVEYCFQCSDYPCTHLEDFRSDECAHHSVVLRNLDEMRRLGPDRWLEEQRLRWSCPHCGVAFTWYDKTCGGCGGEVTNCEDEERQLASGRGPDGSLSAPLASTHT